MRWCLLFVLVTALVWPAEVKARYGRWRNRMSTAVVPNSARVIARPRYVPAPYNTPEYYPGAYFPDGTYNHQYDVYPNRD